MEGIQELARRWSSRRQVYYLSIPQHLGFFIMFQWGVLFIHSLKLHDGELQSTQQ